MNNTVKVFGLDDKKEYLFTATSGYDAINKMLYYLNLGKKDPNSKIEKLRYCWSLTHGGKTYSALI
jgi:hypothetical protein